MSEISREQIVSRSIGMDYFVVDMAIVRITGSWESAGLFNYLRNLYRNNDYTEFAITEEKLFEKMSIGRWSFRNAKKLLIEKGLISCSLKGNPARHYYVINEAKFIDLIIESQSQTSDNKLCGNQTTSCAETKQLYKTISSDHDHEISSEITKVISSEIPPVIATAITEVEEIFSFWQKTMSKPRAVLSPKRKKLIQSALKSYPLDALKRAVLGCKATPFNMGVNDRGEKYNDLEVILRSHGHIERFIENEVNPPIPIRNGKKERADLPTDKELDVMINNHAPFRYKDGTLVS